MDPLSMTASIVAILKLTETVTSYLNHARKASADRTKIAIEAASIYSLLTTLRFRVEEARRDEPWFSQVKMLALENGPLEQFKSTLESMVAKIQPVTSFVKMGKALAWKFDKAEIQDALDKIERLKSLIHLALANDLL
jgi:hypothetical protein